MKTSSPASPTTREGTGTVFHTTRFVMIVSALAVAVSCNSVFAWSHAGFRGGSVSGGGGSWSGTGFRGGTASGSDGSWHADGFRGGTASGGGGSWSAHGADGGTASGGDGSWAAHGADGGYAYHNGSYYGGSYNAYHPPTTVNTYYENGCYDCGGWNTAGAAAAGMAVGATIGAASASAASSNAYAQGYAAGATNTAYAIGSIYTTLPAGCVYTPMGSAAYYKCGGGVWLSPAYGANGVYYRIVPAP